MSNCIVKVNIATFIMLLLLLLPVLSVVSVRPAAAEPQVVTGPRIDRELKLAMAKAKPGEMIRTISLLKNPTARLDPSAIGEKQKPAIAKMTELGVANITGFRMVNSVAAAMTVDQIKQFEASGDLGVDTIFLDRQRRLPNDVNYKQQIEHAREQGLIVTPQMVHVRPLVGAEVANSWGFTGSGVLVAVIDTGVNFMPADLGGGGAPPRGTCGDVDWTGQGYFDNNGHGTFVASEIAAQGAMTYSFGGPIMGIAPGATILGEKVLTDAGWGYDSWIIAGIENAVLVCSANVVSLSLGGLEIPDTGYDPLSMAIQQAYLWGALPVVASGNEGPGIGTVGSPGASPYALTVGASTELSDLNEVLDGYFGRFYLHGSAVQAFPDQMIGFSSTGATGYGVPKPNLVAPGYTVIGISCAYPGPAGPCWNGPEDLEPDGQLDDWGIWAGTSMATPIVSGAAAVVIQALKARFGTWTPQQVMDILASTSKHLGHDALTQGSGRVNVGYAAKLAGGVGSVDGFIVNPSSNLIWPGATQTFTVTNLGTTWISGLKISKVSLASTGKLISGKNTVDTMGMPWDPICGCYLNEVYYDMNVPAGTQALQADLVIHKDNTNGEYQAPQGLGLMLMVYDPMGHLVATQENPDWLREGHMRLFVGAGSGTVDATGKWVPAVLTTGHWTLKVHWEMHPFGGSANYYRIAYDFLVQKYKYGTFSAISSVTPSKIAAIAPGGSSSFNVKAASSSQWGTPAGFIVVSAPGIIQGPGVSMIPVTVPSLSFATGKSTFSTVAEFGRDDDFPQGDWRNYWFYVGSGIPNLMATVSWSDPRTDVDIYLSSEGTMSAGAYAEAHPYGYGAEKGILQALGAEGGGTLSGSTWDFAYVAAPIEGWWLLTLHVLATPDKSTTYEKITVTIDRGSASIAPSPKSISATVKAGASKSVKVSFKNNDVVHEDYLIWTTGGGTGPLMPVWSGGFDGTLDTFTWSGGIPWGDNEYYFTIPPAMIYDSMAIDVSVTWDPATYCAYDGSSGGIGTFLGCGAYDPAMMLEVADQDWNTLGVAYGDSPGPIGVYTQPPMLSGLPWPYSELQGIISVDTATGIEGPPGLPTNTVYEYIVPFHVTWTYYANWSPPPAWLGPSTLVISVDAGKTGTFNFIAAPPPGTTPGTYTGAIVVYDEMRNLVMAIIPYTVTVKT